MLHHGRAAVAFDFLAQRSSRILEPVLNVIGLERLLVLAARERVQELADVRDLIPGRMMRALENLHQTRYFLVRVERGALALLLYAALQVSVG